jgi:thiol:disulfide interchange protein DsbA
MTNSMRLLGIGLILSLLLGCSQHSQDHQISTPNVTAKSIEPVDLPATREKDGSGDETASTDSSASFSPIAAAMAATTPTTSTPINPKWVEGKNYQLIVPAQPTGSAPDKVDVVEVFWYGCPHCFHLDPVLESWSKTGKASYVTFRRMPVIWNDINRAHARLFFTLETLNKLNALHTLTFKEIHENHNPLASQSANETETMQREWLKKNGVSDKDFDAAYHSFGLENSLRRADDFTHRFRVTGVPTFIINGKYVTDVGMAGGEAQVFALIDDLAAAEHKH